MVASLRMQPGTPAPLAGLPVRPAARRFARRLVAQLTSALRPKVARRRRLLAIFVDGLSPRLIPAARDAGFLRFLPALRDAPGMHEDLAFSGMPSSTTAFQAGLFYGLRYPDVPGFGWYDRRTSLRLHMETPSHAAAVEARLRPGNPGLLEGGAGYLSILRGGSPTHFSTAATASVIDGSDRPGLAAPLAATASVQGQAVLRLAVRAAAEAAGYLAGTARHVARTGHVHHERNFFLNRLLLGTLAREVAVGQLLVDLVRGVPRVFLTLHDHDEAAHRRGPDAALESLRSIDATIELLCAVAAELPCPPDPWIFTDHGQIAATPFRKLMGTSLEGWLSGEGEPSPPRLPPAVARALGGEEGQRPGRAPVVVDAGNFAHVYLGAAHPLAGPEIAREHARTLARALRCPAVGLVALRAPSGGAIAFSGGARVDPRDPATVPKGASPRAVAAMLEDLARSPSAGDLVLYGAWYPGGCVSFDWEFSSHGGVSPQETTTFVMHPAGVPFSVDRVSHGADLHHVFRALYGDEVREPLGDIVPLHPAPA